MVSTEERTRRRILKRLIIILSFIFPSLFGSILIYSIVTKDINVFFSYFFTIPVYLLLILNYHFTFKKKKLSTKKSIIIQLFIGLITIIPFTYFSGGYSGALISLYFPIIVISAMFLNPKQALLFSFIPVLVYLSFFFSETYGIITPLVTNRQIIDSARIMIDISSFVVTSYLVVIISKYVADSVKFYRLRSVRLSKIRQRLEFLVKRRTKELADSNKKLKIAQKQLRKNYKELKQLDVRKDEFISIAAHELKTPLTSISGYAQLLKKEKIIRNRKKRNRFLDILDKESRRQSRLVSEILNLSRIDLGTMRYIIEEVNLYEFIRDIEDQYRARFKEKKLKHEFKIGKKLPKITTDKSRLHEIMTNLISNAIKYTPKGKVIISVIKKGRYVQFSIKDTGMGIPRKYQKKIFERFFQVDSSLSRESGGSGLGLSICKEYLKDLGGKIWFKSKKGKGSTFYFTIPIKTKIREIREEIEI